MKFYITSRHDLLQGSHLEQNSSCPSAGVKSPVIHCAHPSKGPSAVHNLGHPYIQQVLGPGSWGSTPACATLSKRFLFSDP